MIFPKLIKVRQKFMGPVVEDVEKKVFEQLMLLGIQERITPGMRIAITAAMGAQAQRDRLTCFTAWGLQKSFVRLLLFLRWKLVK
jgi:hypothetical protein